MRHPIRPLLSLSLFTFLAACGGNGGEATTATTADTAMSGAPIAAPGAAPAADASSDPTADYALTMDKVDRYFAAVREFAALAKADPAMEDATTMNASQEDSTQFALRLEGNPAVAAALAKAGISARDYALTNELLVAALMAQGMVESGALDAIPEGLNPHAVEFVKQHQAELTAKFQALQAEG